MNAAAREIGYAVTDGYCELRKVAADVWEYTTPEVDGVMRLNDRDADDVLENVFPGS